METIKIINEYMQQLKLRIYNSNVADTRIELLEEEYDSILFDKYINDLAYKKARKKSISLIILSLGILYPSQKNHLQIWKELHNSQNQEFEDKEKAILLTIDKIEDDKELLPQDEKYYSQVENFLQLYKNMSKEEKEMCLNYRM